MECLLLLPGTTPGAENNSECAAPIPAVCVQVHCRNHKDLASTYNAPGTGLGTAHTEVDETHGVSAIK